MTEQTFRPNWASAPGETIQAIISARGFSRSTLGTSLAMQDTELNSLLIGQLAISSDLAKRLAAVLGSTPRFWLERDKQYHESLKALELSAPELLRWAQSFPVTEMVKAGWMNKPMRNEAAGELLAFFGVSSLDDWKEHYQARLTQTKFRTSESFENAVGSTTAWIRPGRDPRGGNELRLLQERKLRPKLCRNSRRSHAKRTRVSSYLHSRRNAPNTA